MDAFSHLIESRQAGLLTLSAGATSSRRRVLYLNSYGGHGVWESVRAGELPSQHLWGCLELAQKGYEVAIAEPLRHFNFRRRPLPHDLVLLRAIREWLGRDGIIYCGHTLLYWLPLLKTLGILRNPVVSLTYGREELDFAKAHTGIIAMTPAAADQAKKMAPNAKVVHLAWGCDTSYYPDVKYNPKWFLSCGIANRDLATLNHAAAKTREPIRLVCSGLPKKISWPDNVQVTDSGKGWCFEKKALRHPDLIRDYYAGSTAVLVVLQPDPSELNANGFTNLLEAMALGLPVVITRTGAVQGEIDVEKKGCGLFVPPGNPEALAEAIEALANDPKTAEDLGKKGRHLVANHYNSARFGAELHAFFESL